VVGREKRGDRKKLGERRMEGTFEDYPIPAIRHPMNDEEDVFQ
jgi:hypothetical protein